MTGPEYWRPRAYRLFDSVGWGSVPLTVAVLESFSFEGESGRGTSKTRSSGMLMVS